MAWNGHRLPSRTGTENRGQVYVLEYTVYVHVYNTYTPMDGHGHAWPSSLDDIVVVRPLVLWRPHIPVHVLQYR